jgi:hypothetical protein
MDVKDYSQQLNKVKERYQDAASDIRSSSDREKENIQKAANIKIQKQAEGYAAEKSKMEETATKNNDYYTEKTRNTIAKRQEDFIKDKTGAAEKFDLEKNDLRQKYLDKLADVTGTYKNSTAENNRLHEQSKEMMNERFAKTQDGTQEDYNSKIKKFSDNAQIEIRNEKALDHEKRKNLSSGFQSEIEDLRSKAQEKNFKQVSRLAEDNEKLRTSFDRERDGANEQKEARISDILRMKNEETNEGQKNFAELRKKISDKEAVDREQTRLVNAKEAKSMDQKYNEDLKTIQRLANQKIQSSGGKEALIEDNKRTQVAYENRLKNLSKMTADDINKMSERENVNAANTKEQLGALKTKYNEEREVNDRERDSDKNKTIQKLNEKNVLALERYKEESKLKDISSDDSLDKTKKNSKNLLKEQRVEFGKVVNKIQEKNLEHMSSIKDDFAKDRGHFVAKTQREVSEEKRVLRDQLQQQVSVHDDVNQKKLEEVKKEAERYINNYEVKLEQLARQNEKEMEMLKANYDEKQIKQEQNANFAAETSKQEHQIELKNIRSRFEKVIDRDRIMGEQQTGRIVQKYEDQLDRERIAHQKELSLRTNEAQTQFERLYKASELEKETLRSQYEDRIERMKLSSLEEVNSKKA